MATAVIPAYNEEKHIGRVLDVVRQIKDLAQIVVVDDGSTDNTPDIVEGCSRQDERIQLIRLPANRGKGKAMMAGAEVSESDVTIFLDADLLGLRPEHIVALMKPVQNGACDMTLGVFRQGRRQTDWSHQFIPFLSGQRCLRWSRFQATPGLDSTSWSIEVALSLHAWRNRYQVSLVPWFGVTHVMRLEKIQKTEAYRSYLKMWLEIGAYLVNHVLFERKSFQRSEEKSRAFKWQFRLKLAWVKQRTKKIQQAL